MRRSGGPVILVGMIALVVIGVALRRWEVVATCVSAFVFYGLVCVSYISKRPRFKVRRIEDRDVIKAGEKTVVTLEVVNLRDSSPGFVEVFDVLPDTVELVKGKNHRVFNIGPYETKRIKYQVRFHIQGETRIGPLKWRTMDRSGFFFDQGVVKKETKVMVRRMVEDARKLQIPSMKSTRPFGHTPTRVKGSGTEFYGLREYVTTDSLRIVNWKATARLGRLISKEFEDERLGDVVLVIDMRPGSRIGEGSTNTVDAAVNGALAVAQKVLSERNRLSIVYLRGGIGWISGITTRRRIQEIVDKADFPEELEEYPIHWLPWTIRKSFPTKAHVVVFSSMLEDSMAGMLKEIGLMGYGVLLVSPSPASSNIRLYDLKGLNPSLRISRNLILLKRKNRLLRLKKIMQVVDWDFGEPLALTLKRVEKRRGGGRWQRSKVSRA